jgi:SAM-dependent methyltransferase
MIKSRLLKHLKYLLPLSKVSKHDLIVRKSTGKSVLDLGCVDHSHLCAIQDPHWIHGAIRQVATDVVGVDILREEVDRLNETGFESVICGDALTIRLERLFDVVVIGDLIEHVANPEALLLTVKCHLRPGGEVIITTPNPFYINQFLGIIVRGSVFVNPEHTCWFDKETMYTLLQRCGFTVTEFHWLQDTWGIRTLISWCGFRGIRKVLTMLILFALMPVYILSRFRIWGYFSSDFAVIARCSNDKVYNSNQ